MNLFHASINIMNLFHAFVWLNKAMKLLIKNYEIHPISSIPKKGELINENNIYCNRIKSIHPYYSS